ncbi:36908_t:CDS:1, partial [Racocetra persica]
ESILSELFNKKTLKRKLKKQRKNKYKELYEKYKKLYTNEKKQNGEYISLLNDACDYFGKSWREFLNDIEEAKQSDDYSRYLVNDILKEEDQLDNEEVINLTNEEGVIDNVVLNEDFDYEYYFKLDKNNTFLIKDCCFMQHFEDSLSA